MPAKIRKRVILKTEALLRYFLGDERMDNLVMCTPEDVELFAYDLSIYEALASLETGERDVMAKVIKLMESVNVVSYSSQYRRKKPLLTPGRAVEIRKNISSEVST